MDDVSARIDAATKRRMHKVAILTAIRAGWTALAPILATTNERVLTEEEKVAVVTAFVEEDAERVAFDLASRWRLRHRLPPHIRAIIDPPRKEKRSEARRKETGNRPHQPLRRAG